MILRHRRFFIRFFLAPKATEKPKKQAYDIGTPKYETFWVEFVIGHFILDIFTVQTFK